MRVGALFSDRRGTQMVDFGCRWNVNSADDVARGRDGVPRLAQLAASSELDALAALGLGSRLFSQQGRRTVNALSACWPAWRGAFWVVSAQVKGQDLEANSDQCPRLRTRTAQSAIVTAGNTHRVLVVGFALFDRHNGRPHLARLRKEGWGRRKREGRRNEAGRKGPRRGR